jgi:soluble lytic murein transglycosylase
LTTRLKAGIIRRMTGNRNVKTHLLTVLAVGFLLVGCAGGSPLSSVLNPATATPTPLPTATPSPTPSPTPTPVPAEVVGQGQRDLHNGNWDAASEEFQQVLVNPSSTVDEVVEAQLGLADVSLQRGDFASARAVLDSMLAQYPDHSLAAQAIFLRGEANLGLSSWQDAIVDFQTYQASKPGLIDSYVYERIGDAYLALDQNDQAVAVYEQAVAADRYLAGQLQLREKVAIIYRSLGNAEAAATHYRAILDASENAAYRATIEFALAQTLLEGGQTDAGYEQLSHVFMTYPQSYEALSALIALRDAGYELDPYQRGLVNFNNDLYENAPQYFYDYLAATEPRDYRPEAYLYIAYSYRQIGNLQAALTELQTLIDNFDPEDTAWGDAWLEVGSIYAELGDTAAAYTTYEQFAADYPEVPQAADALYQAGLLAESLGDNTRAIFYYQQLAASYSADERAAQGLFRIGLSTFLVGDVAAAEMMFVNTSQLPANADPAASQFWLAKTWSKAGRAEEASAAFAAVQSIDQAGFYGLRAADINAGRPPFWQAGTVSFPADMDEGRAEAEAWLVQQFGLATSPPLAVGLRGDVATDIRMIRGTELWSLGLQAEARQDFESLRVAYQDDPLASYQLAVHFRDIGLYRSSILAARRVHQLAGVSPLEAPVFLARLNYPTYFSDLILEYVEQYQLDPLFVYALIWQESLFEGFAVSSASAQGLMQIWPPTGEDIAARLSWPNYQSADLQRPYVSVAFGTWLLRDEYDRFGGDPFAILSAYNAGPGNTATWREAAGGDPDLFVEFITLPEPQAYIKVIYAHYAVYRSLYGAE